VERTVIARRADLAEPAPPDTAEDSAAPKPIAETTPTENHLTVRTRERYEAIRQLRDAGASISAISRQLDLDRNTIKRFARAADVEEVLVRAGTRGSLLDAFKPHLHERFNAGHTDAAALTQEITALGYRGSEQTVRRYLHPSGPASPPHRRSRCRPQCGTSPAG
jgi:transposase